jgi:hypothetical protein
VYVVTSGELARAWQSFGDFEVVTDDAENELRDELFANRDFTVF